MNIVVLDTDHFSTHIIKNCISKIDKDFKVDRFKVPEHALKFMEENKTDVLFTEVELAGIDGFTIAKKARFINPKINVIFVTNAEQYAVEAFKIHVSGFILKPVTTQKVKNELDNLWFKIE